MIPVPSNKADLLDLTNTLVEQCRVSVGMRSSFYQTLNQITETGRYDGGKALVNKMFKILDRTKSHLFSNIELKFAMDFDRPRRRVDYDRASEAATVLGRTWERNGTGTTFQQGVFESLKYGACVHKQWVEMEGPEQNKPCYYDKLVMPWQFGVYREDENHLDRQEALCETITLTLPEVWKRIYHRDDAKQLFNKIKTHAQAGQSTANPQSFFHDILSTSQLDTSSSPTTRPGGIMQLNNAPNYSTMGPIIAPETVQMHELWVKDDTGDYTTIQQIEPDIIIAPFHKRINLLDKDSGLQPYRLIQPNVVTNWVWGRSELMDLVEPQGLLAQWCDDARRLMGIQFDKLMAFSGEGGLTDELYGQMRYAGYTNLPQGAGVTDLTPKFPPETLPMLQFLIRTIDELAGYPPIMQGQGDTGVRANDQTQTLMKTASPTLRDRSLLVENQCAAVADLTFELMQAKDESNYWLKAEPVNLVDETKFLLSELPDDLRVTVDSHSSSPIFSEENAQLIFAAAKLGYVTGEYVLDNMSFPNKELAKLQLKDKETQQAKFMENLMNTRPDIADKILLKQMGGGKR